MWADEAEFVKWRALILVLRGTLLTTNDMLSDPPQRSSNRAFLKPTSGMKNRANSCKRCCHQSLLKSLNLCIWGIATNRSTYHRYLKRLEYIPKTQRHGLDARVRATISPGGCSKRDESSDKHITWGMTTINSEGVSGPRTTSPEKGTTWTKVESLEEDTSSG